MDDPGEMPPPAPTPESARIDSLDLMRGVAVLAILLVNINSMGLPGSSFATPHQWDLRTPYDLVVYQLNYVFIQQKFIGLFSLLFGVGLFIQLERAEERGADSLWLHLRRLAFLGSLGLVHAVLFWPGDVLTWYAVLGIPLYWCRRIPRQWLLPVALGLWVVPALFCVLPLEALGRLGRVMERADFNMAAPPEGFSWEVMSDIVMELPHGVATHAHLMGSGSFSDITAFRAVYFLFYFGIALMMLGWALMAYMLLGIWLFQAGVFTRPAEHAGLLRVAGYAGLLGGLTLLGAAAVGLVPRGDALGEVLSRLVLFLTAPLLMLAYVAIMLSVGESAVGRALTAPLRACGRMALTNYLLPSVLLVPLFCGYGLGWFGRLGYMHLAGIAMAFWVFQVVFSVLWLRWFRFGPLEWLWRCFTYWRLQPIRR